MYALFITHAYDKYNTDIYFYGVFITQSKAYQVWEEVNDNNTGNRVIVYSIVKCKNDTTNRDEDMEILSYEKCRMITKFK